MLAMMLPLIMFYIMQQTFYFSTSNFPSMYVELTTPRIAAWNDFFGEITHKVGVENAWRIWQS